jgi:EmrB/QacA subfamily drug resistance transporter
VKENKIGMKFPFSHLATDKNRWKALVFLALGLAIVIIDNTVLNVAIPYILRDLNTSFAAIQWVVSGYALIIATVLIAVGRLGDVVGRKKIFLLGTVLFAIGSFIASIAPSILILFLGEALIEALGAAMMMTSSLSLLAGEFQGKERAIAFGVWGSVAGASAAVGPLLGGYLTAYYSWRWSLRINVLIAVIAILGSVFIKESRGKSGKSFDFLGTFLSGLGLASLIFALIEGSNYGWWTPNELFSLGSFSWTLNTISIIPFVFFIALLLLSWFFIHEYRLEQAEKEPLIRLSMFRSRGFSLGLATLMIIAIGQLGVFFIMPIYLQDVLGFNAFQTGLVFLPASLMALIFGPLSGFISSRIGPKWIVVIGMCFFSLGAFLLWVMVSVDSTVWTLLPGLMAFGIGIGMASAQLTNTILSAVDNAFAGEASALNSTVRQIGSSIGSAIIGVVLAGTVVANISSNIHADSKLPTLVKQQVIVHLQSVSPESGQMPATPHNAPQSMVKSIKTDVDQALVSSSKNSLFVGFLFIVLGTVLSLFLPQTTVSVSPQSEESEEVVLTG